jgi:hypothetical protein
MQSMDGQQDEDANGMIARLFKKGEKKRRW